MALRTMHKPAPLVWLLLLGGCALALAQENLVKNPGFEEPAKANGLPGGGWWLYEGQGETGLSLDGSVAHSGKASAKLHAGSQAKSVLVSAPFAVMPGDEIRFQAWVRGKDLESGAEQIYAGLAFRQANGSVFQRAYDRPDAVNGAWSLISGVAKAPDGATTAEMHLGYTNAPATLWFDDVAAVIMSPLSFALTRDAQPWPGPQDLTLLVVNRATNQFRGTISATVGRRTQTVPVVLASRTNQHVQLPITLTGEGTHNYKISLLDSSGAPVSLLQGKFRTKPPLTLYPACPCYHAAREGNGDTRIDASVNLNPAQRAGLRMSVEVSDAAGNKLKTATTDASQGETVGVKVRVPVVEPAVFGITARLIDRSGKEIAKAATEVQVCLAKDTRVTIGPEGFLQVAGQPHFPIGMYSSGHDEEMGKAGFSATHNYGITTGEANDAINPNEARLKELLDRSMANGMRMMVELPRKAIEAAQWQQVRRRIETFRHHPGLLCWGSEERVARGAAPLANVASLYRIVHELDPDHPFVLGDTKDVIRKFQADRRDFFPDACMDIGIWWWYPIPLKDPDGNGLDRGKKVAGILEPPSWLTTTISKRPLWIAIQSYQHPRKDARFPTPAEYRCLAYLSIINGVKGLWFYTGSGQRDYLGKPAGLLNKPEEGHWGYVQKLAGELRDFSPVIMAPAGAAKLSISPAGAPVEYTLRDLEGKLYLLAANKSDHPQSIRFSGSPLTGKRAQVLYETRQVAVKGDSLTDDFTAFGVRVYKLE
jgi:hypothetical protein